MYNTGSFVCRDIIAANDAEGIAAAVSDGVGLFVVTDGLDPWEKLLVVHANEVLSLVLSDNLGRLA